jgi:hypothetical protein
MGLRLGQLFSVFIPDDQEKPGPSLVDCSFLDNHDGKPGELADRVKNKLDCLRKKWMKA